MALHLPINAACSLSCVFCSAQGRRGRYSLASLLSEIDRDKTGDVQISGGEPLARKPEELLKILLWCRKKGKRVELQTNGTLIDGYAAQTLKLLAGLVGFFNINFSAHTPEVESAVTGCSEAFARRARGVRRLLGLGAVVRLNYVVCRPNYRHCASFVRFARAELPGFSWIQFSYCKAMGRAAGGGNAVPRFKDAAPFLRKACRLCETLGIGFEIDHIPVCFVAEFKEHHVDYRKMRRRSPGAHLDEKRRVARCASCSMKDACPGPRKDYIEIYGDL